MKILAYISFIFLFIQLIQVLINRLVKQKMKSSKRMNSDLVSVLIPARNEESNISLLLSDLHKMQNSRLEIIVFDDDSTDSTSQQVQKMMLQDARISLRHAHHLPVGWLGKNHACQQLALHASGRYFLFLDADVRVDDGLIDDAVAYMQMHRLHLLSVFPVQLQLSLGEKMIVPLMNYILLSLLPLIFVRISPFASHAAANGQFMLFDAHTYKLTEPHSRLRHCAIEDIAIARYFKKLNLKIACIAGEARIRCRMYHSAGEAMSGFSKNLFMFFGNSVLFALLFWLFSAGGLFAVCLGLPHYSPIYLFMLILMLVLYASVSRQNILHAVVLYPVQQLFFLLIMIRAVINRKNKKLKWKERNIYS